MRNSLLMCWTLSGEPDFQVYLEVTALIPLLPDAPSPSVPARKRVLVAQWCQILFNPTHFGADSLPPGPPKISCPCQSKSEVAQSCPTLWDPRDCSLGGFSIHGIFQLRVLEWVAISFAKGYSRPRVRTRVSLIASRRFYPLSRQGSCPCQDNVKQTI